MKRIKIILGIVSVSLVLNISCSTDFLNTEPLDKIASSATWSDGALSEAFMYNVYSYLYYGGFHEEGMASATDEAMFTHGRGYYVLMEGTETPSNPGWLEQPWQWNNMYLAIRQANVALQELPNSTFEDDDLRERLMGEALFLRAFYYHNLVSVFGGVPLIDKPYGLGEEYSIPRNTYKECVDFIVSDLDQAASMLNGKEETPGRASKIAAMALKARVLLHAASDLHDATIASGLFSGFSNIELVAIQGGDRAARWAAARDAAKAVLDSNPGWKMNLTAPVSHQEGIENYVSLSMGGGSSVADAGAAVELLFQRTHTPLYTVEDNWPLGGINWGINNGPNGYHNWAGNTPIQQLVDDYEMMDGSKFDWNNAAHAAAPYTDRDPRFYGTILYDGADWKPRPADVAGKDPANQIQTGYYDDGAGGTINGIDTRESPVENWNGSRTHYYVRKFIDPNPGLSDDFSSAQVVPWPFLRTTEMALSYAEACVETDQLSEATLWLNRIRFRAGMPAVTETDKAGLRARVRQERRIELAYEDQRYFDARRWVLDQINEGLGRQCKSINIVATLKAGATPHVPYRYDTNVYDYTYTPQSNTETETRTWVNKMYFRPISRDEINRNELLIQNPGYDK